MTAPLSPASRGSPSPATWSRSPPVCPHRRSARTCSRFIACHKHCGRQPSSGLSPAQGSDEGLPDHRVTVLSLKRSLLPSRVTLARIVATCPAPQGQRGLTVPAAAPEGRVDRHPLAVEQDRHIAVDIDQTSVWNGFRDLRAE